MLVILIQLICSSAFAGEKFDIKSYISASVEGLTLQNEAHLTTWGIGSAEQWNVDQTKGIIYWTFSDGKIAIAPVQIIGTFNPKDNTFLWAWDHPSVLEPLRAHAKLVKKFGEKHKIEKFTKRKITISHDEAWELVAVANRLASANGGYRGDAGGPIVFMTFGKLELKKEP